ncbi:MAG: pyruvate kinase [Actinobacteria bacterium]|nr:pyruvate kinase [Actinomycetota bacterium]
MRLTKIVGTIGPASNNYDVIVNMIKAGLDVVRLNLSHSSPEKQAEVIKKVRKASEETGKPVGIMIDLKGLKIRIKLAVNEIFVKKGDIFTFITEPPVRGNSILINYPGILSQLMPQNTIFIDDGFFQFKVKEIKKESVVCEALNEGNLRSGKGVNIPEISLDLPALTEEDKKDLDFMLNQEIDLIAMSYVKDAADIMNLKDFIGDKKTMVIGKIERREAVENIDEIISASDGVMIARGDLGVEIPLEEVPVVQKQIIDKANKAGKPVITATQMLESMTNSPRPTRAEVNDVANAIFDGTDALMLSGETAVGKYPVDCIVMMDAVAGKTELALNYEIILEQKNRWIHESVTDAISFGACKLANDLKAKLIVVPTQTGYTARNVSKYRPAVPVFALSSEVETMRQLSVSRGIRSFLINPSRSIDDVFNQAVDICIKEGNVKKGEKIVITAGALVNVPGTTNLIKVYQIT